MPTLRDKLWLWGHGVDAHGPHTQWQLPRESRMTPVEAAAYMGIPNMHMVWLWRKERPEPTPSWRQYAIPLRAMKQVVWSVALGHGLSYTDHIFPLIADEANVTGVILDDFFTPQDDGRITALSNADFALINAELAKPHISGRKLQLHCVVYEQDLGKPIGDLLDRMDVLTYFMWNSASVPHIDEHLKALDALAPSKPKVLGLYMWDYAAKQPMPMDLVEQQCETALRLFEARRVEGITFCATCICDLELDAVEYTRAWIADVGDRTLL